MGSVSVTVEGTASVSADTAFGAVIPIDLTATFTGYGPFPAVVGIEHQPGKWDAAGKSRTVLLRGGGTMRERMVEYEPPVRAAYEVIPHEGPLKLLVERINGQFVFRELQHGHTEITWTYEFVPRRGGRPLLLVLVPLWRRYARQLIARFVAAAERTPS
ncbi:MAG: SRPBCC family protein [Solirubrobacteraceae bacterium]|nr:SRPBCC family protein [Solirubrobacteraceae bacterium]